MSARNILMTACLIAAFGLGGTAQAGPGAHGPNGEHLDGPATSVSQQAAAPRIEAHTEAFELVATWRDGQLSVWVDRFESNAPVLGATLEAEVGGLKATGQFRPEQGDYVFTDPKLLAVLAQPGQHPLVFTLVAGADSDLIDGVLDTRSAEAVGAHATHDGHDDEHGEEAHDHPERRWTPWVLGGMGSLVALSLGGWAWSRTRRARANRLTQGQ
jgi:hypothetical protein